MLGWRRRAVGVSGERGGCGLVLVGAGVKLSATTPELND